MHACTMCYKVPTSKQYIVTHIHVIKSHLVHKFKCITHIVEPIYAPYLNFLLQLAPY